MVLRKEIQLDKQQNLIQREKSVYKCMFANFFSKMPGVVTISENCTSLFDTDDVVQLNSTKMCNGDTLYNS